MREDELLATVGRRFPGGRARIEPYVDWLVRDMLGAPQDPSCLHPTSAYLVGQGGVGIELSELFAVFGSSSDDGPMLGEWGIEIARPLHADVEYAVRAQVSDARRRSGRTGVLDLVTLTIELVGPDGTAHAAVRQTYVFPRRATEGAA